jgi:hypothetical protein
LPISPAESLPRGDGQLPIFEPPGPTPAAEEDQPSPIPGTPGESTAPSFGPDTTPSTADSDPGAAADQPPASQLSALLGATAEAAGVPEMIGDNFGSASTQSIIPHTIPFSVSARGYIIDVDTMTDLPTAFAYEVGTSQPANDFFSVGSGIDADGDGHVETFAISEPVPPTDAPTSPGPTFAFDGGTAVHPTGVIDDGDLWQADYSFTERRVVVLPDPSSGGAVVGRLKIADHSSPLPMDRFFIDYSAFHNVALVPGGVSVNRFHVGLEKTFLDQLVSLEVRALFAGTLSSNFVVDAPASGDHFEAGNIMLAVKGLLYDSGRTAVSAGLGLIAPTADDFNVFLADGTELIAVKNESVHLMPFLGWLRRYRNGFFAHGFTQLDVDANGNPVRVNRVGEGLVAAGNLQDATFLYSDFGVGYYWRRRGRQGILPIVTGYAPTLELHHNFTLESTEALRFDDFQIGQRKENIQILNFIVGNTIQFADRSSLTVGYATPIGNGSDQPFDGELRLIWSRRL